MITEIVFCSNIYAFDSALFTVKGVNFKIYGCIGYHDLEIKNLDNDKVSTISRRKLADILSEEHGIKIKTIK